jgi:hypothetical protein
MRRALTLLVVLAAAGVIGLIAWSLVGGDDEPAVHEATSDGDGLSVTDAINRAPDIDFAVRGYVFDDGAFVQLCQGIVMTEPPRCRGPVLLLHDLDLARVNLLEAKTVRYTDEPVILGGRINGTQLFVVDVLAARSSS